ncbi:MAG TPA: hypothetical protein V6D17_02900, partial [Candidatus Obscuribacterales bacterium]
QDPAIGTKQDPTLAKQDPATGTKQDPTLAKQDPATGTKQEPTTGTKQDPATGTKQDPTLAKQDPATGMKQEPTTGTKQEPPAGTKQDPTLAKQDLATGTKQDPTLAKQDPTTGTKKDPTTGTAGTTKQEPTTGTKQEPTTGTKQDPTSAKQDPSTGTKQDPTFAKQDPTSGTKQDPTLAKQDPTGGTRTATNTDPTGAQKVNTDPTGSTRSATNTDPTGAQKVNTDPTGSTRIATNTDPTGAQKVNTDPTGGTRTATNTDPTVGTRTATNTDPAGTTRTVTNADPTGAQKVNTDPTGSTRTATNTDPTGAQKVNTDPTGSTRTATNADPTGAQKVNTDPTGGTRTATSTEPTGTTRTATNTDPSGTTRTATNTDPTGGTRTAINSNPNQTQVTNTTNTSTTNTGTVITSDPRTGAPVASTSDTNVVPSKPVLFEVPVTDQVAPVQRQELRPIDGVQRTTDGVVVTDRQGVQTWKDDTGQVVKSVYPDGTQVIYNTDGSRLVYNSDGSKVQYVSAEQAARLPIPGVNVQVGDVAIDGTLTTRGLDLQGVPKLGDGSRAPIQLDINNRGELGISISPNRLDQMNINLTGQSNDGAQIRYQPSFSLNDQQVSGSTFQGASKQTQNQIATNIPADSTTSTFAGTTSGFGTPSPAINIDATTAAAFIQQGLVQPVQPTQPTQPAPVSSESVTSSTASPMGAFNSGQGTPPQTVSASISSSQSMQPPQHEVQASTPQSQPSVHGAPQAQQIPQAVQSQSTTAPAQDPSAFAATIPMQFEPLRADNKAQSSEHDAATRTAATPSPAATEDEKSHALLEEVDRRISDDDRFDHDEILDSVREAYAAAKAQEEAAVSEAEAKVMAAETQQAINTLMQHIKDEEREWHEDARENEVKAHSEAIETIREYKEQEEEGYRRHSEYIAELRDQELENYNKREQQFKEQRERDEEARRRREEKEEERQKKEEQNAKRLTDAMLTALATRRAEEAAIKARADALWQEQQRKEEQIRQDNKQQKYVVRPNDTLDSIASKKLRDPKLAELIYALNQDKIEMKIVNGKRVYILKPHSVITLPSPKQIREWRQQKLSQSTYGTVTYMSPEAKAAADQRRANVESLLGPIGKPVNQGIQYNVRLGDTLRSIAMKHPALGDVALWKLLAEKNKLPITIDEKGAPTAALRRGTQIVLPTADEIAEFKRRNGLDHGNLTSGVQTKFELVSKECPSCHRLTTAHASVCPGCAYPLGAVTEVDPEAVTLPIQREVLPIPTNHALQQVQSTPSALPIQPIADPSDSDVTTISMSDEPPRTVGTTVQSFNLLSENLDPVEQKWVEETILNSLIEKLGENCRVVHSETADGRIRTQLEVLTGETWIAILTYEVCDTTSVRHEFAPDGRKKTMPIDLPAAAAQELIQNDLQSNWQEYCRKFLAGKRLTA